MSAPPSELKQLEALVGAPTTRTVVIDGVDTEIKVQRIKVGRIPPIIKAAGGLLGYLTSDGYKLDYFRLMALHADDCLNLLAALSEQPREVIDNLDVDDAARLFMDVIELNLDFFVRRVVPLLSEEMARLLKDVKGQQQVVAATGLTPSSDSSATVTPNTPSSNTPT